MGIRDFFDDFWAFEKFRKKFGKNQEKNRNKIGSKTFKKTYFKYKNIRAVLLRKIETI